MKHLSAFFRPVTNALSAWSVGLHSFFSHLLISAGSLPQRNVSVTSASAAIVGTPSRRRRGLMLKPLALMLLFLLGSVNVWGATKVISYEDETQDAETTISASNQSSGTAGKVSWSATSATWNSNKTRWEWAANSTITFSVESGYIITQVIIKTSSTKQTISVTPNSATITGNASSPCTISDINASSVTISIPSAGAYYIKNENVYVYYTQASGDDPGSPDPALSSIQLSGTPTKTTYEQGQSFDPNGLTVTAYYDDDTNADVTGDVEWSFNPASFSVVGTNKSVTATATYNDKEDTKIIDNITVNEHVVTPGTYDITLSNVLFGTSVNANITKEETGSQNDITLKINGTGSTKPRTDATYVRFYGSSSLTLLVPDGYNLTEIKITKNESDYSAPTVTVGSFNTSTKTWTGKAQEVVLSFSAKSFIDDIKVTYEAIAPEVTVDPEELSFEAKQNIAVEGKTFTLEGANLSSGLTLAASEGFAVSPTSLTAEAAMAEGGVEVTVTPAIPTETTTPVEGTVTISGGGLANDVEVPLSMAVTPTYAVGVAVNENAMGSATMDGGIVNVYKASGETVALVAIPASGHEFVSWTATSGISFDNANNPNATATITAAGTITANFQVQACTSLAAPTLNGEIAKTYNSATIAWNAVENASVGYEVYVYNDAQKTSTKVSNLVTVGTSFEVDDLAANTTYYYTVMAVGDGTSYCEENNPLLEGSFTTEDYPAATLTLSEVGAENDYTWGSGLKLNSEIALPSSLQHSEGCSGKVLVGWSSVAIAEPGDEPTANYWEAGADYTMLSTADKLYAVYATGSAAGDVEKLNEDFSGITSGNSTSTNGSSSAWTPNSNFSSTKNNVYQAGGAIRLGKSGSLITKALDLSSGAVTVSFKLKGWASGEKTITVQVDDQTAQSTTCTGYIGSGDFESKSLTFAAGTSSSVVKFTTSSSVRVFVDDIVVSVAAEASYSDYTTACEAALPVLDAPTGLTAGTYYEEQTITLAATNDAAIYYSLDGNDPTVDAQHLYSEPFTLSERGTTTIKAIAVKDGFEDSEIATATYTINLPFTTVADLFSYLEENNLTSLNDAIVTGVISGVTEVSTSFGNATYTISNDGTATAQLQVFRGKYVGNVAVDNDNKDKFVNGNKVTVRGNIETSSNTLRFAQNNYMTELTEKVLSSIVVGGTASKTTYSEEDKQFSFAGLTATAAYSNTGYSADVTADATWKAAGEASYEVAASGDVNVTATYGGLTSDPVVVAVTFTTKTIASISLSYNSTYTFEGFDLPTPTVTASYVEDIDDEDITDLVAAANGFDTESAYNKNVANTYTIKVAYAEKEATYTVEVKPIYNTQATAYSVADAIKLIKASSFTYTTADTKNLYVRGIVSEVGSISNGKLGYYINDTESTDRQLQVFQGLYFGNESFTNDNILAVGDEVIIEGHMLYYNSATPELKLSPLVYLLKKALPTISVEDVAELEVGQADLDITELITKQGNGVVSLESGDLEKLTVDGLILHAVGAGDVTVTANLEATNNANSVNYKANSTTFNVHVIATRPRYTVTFANGGATGGSAPEAIANQLENAKVYLPTNTYSWANHGFDGWAVATASDNVTIDEDENGKYFLMPAANVTITATWEELATTHIIFNTGGVTNEVAAVDIPQGETAYTDFPEADDKNGYEFVGWAENVLEETETAPTLVTTYTPNTDAEKTFYAIYSRLDDSDPNYGKYEKATTVAEGDYLIVCENQNVVFDGSLTTLDAADNNKAATIADGILTLANADNYVFTISEKTGGYSIKSASNKYIGHSGSGNALKESGNDDFTNTISISGGDATISCNNMVLKYNDASNQNRFRYFGSGQKAIQLYKKNEGTILYTSYPVEKVTITFDVNGGEGGCEKAVINKGSQLTICAEEPTKTHSDFTGWKNGDDVYVAGQAYTFDADITLTAQWDPAATYTVTYAANGATAGIAPTDATEYYAGDDVTVLGKGDLEKDDYDFQGWKYDGKLYAAGASFTMPASAVEFVAQWKKQNISTETMTLVTEASQLVNGSKVVIAINNEQYQYLAGQLSTTNSKYLIAENTGVTFSGTEVTYSNANVTEWTLVKAAGGWQLMNGDNYLGESGDNLTVGTTNATVWNITISNGNIAMTSGDYTIRFNPNLQSGVPSTPRFKTYGSTSTMALPQLYASVTAITDTENPVAISDLGYVEGDVIVVNSGVELAMNAPSAPASITVKDGATVTVSAATEADNLIVENGGQVNVSAGTLNVDNLYIQSNLSSVSSSQIIIINAANLNLSGDAYFDITFANSAVTAGWYAFAVPFQVDVQNGIYNAKNGAKLTNEKDYAVMTYQGDVRANGEYGWIKVHKKGGKLVPGQLYIIAFGDTEYNKIRFKKDAGATLNTSNKVTINAYSSGVTTDAGWNGIGNSTLHYADVAYTPKNGSESIEHAQYLDHSANAFVLNDNVDIVDEGYVVGSAFFVQAPAAGIMAFDSYTDGSLHAPARNEVAEEFMLTISKEGKFQDRLFVSASETASNDYEIGHDLVKLGAVSGAAKVAQIAVNGYNDINLCDAEFPLVNNQAIFPLVLTAPATGTYTIAVERYADADLYLTYQGTVIWNLTESPYDLSLMKGRTDEYGLLLNATGRGVSTGVEQQIEKNGVEKFVMNDQLYILHNGVLYNANGQKVK